jgi:hypothetical protein
MEAILCPPTVQRRIRTQGPIPRLRFGWSLPFWCSNVSTPFRFTILYWSVTSCNLINMCGGSVQTTWHIINHVHTAICFVTHFGLTRHHQANYTFIVQWNVFSILLHVHPLLDNVLVKKFLRTQMLGKQSVARLLSNRWGCVVHVVRAEQRWNNGVMQHVSKQRLGKHISAWAVTSAIIETVFSVGSVQSAYKRSECSDRVGSGQLRVSRKLEEWVQKNF